MTPERYRQIGELYHAALELDANERAAFLARSCAGDEELRREVESLLSSHDESKDFILAPALAVAAELLTRSETDPLVGQIVGRYHVQSLVGAGGMGRVYLAEDTELGRRVALKLLAAYLTSDKTQVQRFRQEARAASALNHPNILTVHEVGRAGESEFIVTEYIEGETLRERLTRRSVNLGDALDIAAQVADALAAAHGAGIVHRDVKPENVMLRPDGYVKVLDFGLAKLAESLSPPLRANADGGSRSSVIRTNPGVVMGTVQYMSPEQARGLAVDARTDIWSLGCILYEMLAHRPPFQGATYSDTLVAILDHEPPPLVQHLPAELGEIIQRALTKDVVQRYHTSNEMATDLKRLRRRLEVEAEFGHSPISEADVERETGTQGSASAALRATQVQPISTSSLEYAVNEIKRHKTSVALAGVLLVAALAGVSFGLYKFFGRVRPGGSGAPFKVTPLTSAPGIERSVAFSPDGKQVAFVWNNGDADFDVYVKLIGAGDPLRLTTNPAREMSPAWSPDGRYIAFLRATGEGKGYYLIPALGGAERKMLEAYGWPQRGVMVQAVAWSPDGHTLALVDKAAEDDRWSIFLLSVETGERRKFTSPPARTGDTTVAFSPDGRTLAFVRSHNLLGDIYLAPGDIYLAPVAGGDPVRLTSDEATIYGLAWTPDGAELVFSSERGGSGFPTLWRIPAAGGASATVVSLGDGLYDPSISGQGNRLAFAQLSYDANIYRVEVTAQPGGRRKVGPPTNLIYSTRAETDPQFSPDGRRVVFISNRSGKPNLWVCDADGKNPAQLTDGLDVNAPSWSPDGRHIAFDAVAGGNADIYAVSADGGVARRLTTDPSAETTPSWSSDGSWVYFSSNRTGHEEVWKMPAAGGAAVQLTRGGGFNPVPTPDGRTVYYLHDEKEPWLWVVSEEGGAETRVFEPNQGKHIEPGNWVLVKSGIYFLEGQLGNPSTLKFFDFETRRTTPLATLGRAGTGFQMIGLTVAPDERSILYAQRDKFDLDLMLVENFR